jgi:hypothetical protein
MLLNIDTLIAVQDAQRGLERELNREHGFNMEAIKKNWRVKAQW